MNKIYWWATPKKSIESYFEYDLLNFLYVFGNNSLRNNPKERELLVSAFIQKRRVLFKNRETAIRTLSYYCNCYVSSLLINVIEESDVTNYIKNL